MPTPPTHAKLLDDAAKLTRARALSASGAARAIRTANRLSLAEMARFAGIASPVTVLRWEKGERSPRGAAAIRYCELLDRLPPPDEWPEDLIIRINTPTGDIPDETIQRLRRQLSDL